MKKLLVLTPRFIGKALSHCRFDGIYSESGRTVITFTGEFQAKLLPPTPNDCRGVRDHAMSLVFNQVNSLAQHKPDEVAIYVPHDNMNVVLQSLGRFRDAKIRLFYCEHLKAQIARLQARLTEDGLEAELIECECGGTVALENFVSAWLAAKPFVVPA